MCEPLIVVVSLSDTPLLSIDGPTGLESKITALLLKRMRIIGEGHPDSQQQREDLTPECEEPTATLWHADDVGESQVSSLGSPSPVRVRDQTDGSSPTKRGFGMTDVDAYMSHDEIASEAEVDAGREEPVDAEQPANEAAELEPQDVDTKEDVAYKVMEDGKLSAPLPGDAVDSDLPDGKVDAGQEAKPTKDFGTAELDGTGNVLPSAQPPSSLLTANERRETDVTRFGPSAREVILGRSIEDRSRFANAVLVSSVGVTYSDAKLLEVEMPGTASHLPSPASSVRSLDQLEGERARENPTEDEFKSSDSTSKHLEPSQSEPRLEGLFTPDEDENYLEWLAQLERASRGELQRTAPCRLNTTSPEPPNPVRTVTASEAAETGYDGPLADQPEEIEVVRAPEDYVFWVPRPGALVQAGPEWHKPLFFNEPLGGLPLCANDALRRDTRSGDLAVAMDDAGSSQIGHHLVAPAKQQDDARVEVADDQTGQAAQADEIVGVSLGADHAAGGIEGECGDSQGRDHHQMEGVEATENSRDRSGSVEATDDAVKDEGFVDEIGSASADALDAHHSGVLETDATEHVQQASDVDTQHHAEGDAKPNDLGSSTSDVLDTDDGTDSDEMEGAVGSEASAAAFESEDDTEEADNSLEKANSTASSQQSGGESEFSQGECPLSGHFVATRH